MKKINLLATAALAAMMTLTSCDEDNGNVWSDEDVATRSLDGVTDEYSMLDNGLFNLAYPKDWSCVYSHVKGGIDETRIVGPDVSVDVFIMPFNMAVDKMMEFLAKEELPEDVHLVRNPVSIGGIRGNAYTFEDKGDTGNTYWFRNGNKTIGFFIVQKNGLQTDYSLEESLRWKAVSNSSTDWLSEAKEFAKLISEIWKEEEGYKHEFMEVIPEESRIIIRYESDAEVMSREEAEERLGRFVNYLLAIKECAKHGYMFQIDGVTSEGKTLFSHEFTPGNYQIDEE